MKPIDALKKAEAKYLEATGWTRFPRDKRLWVAPKFEGLEHCNAVFPGDTIVQDRAVQTQKYYESENP